jgi:CIC family chloride channel protein
MFSTDATSRSRPTVAIESGNLAGPVIVLPTVAHAPIMAIVMMLETIRPFMLILPVMPASGVACSIDTPPGAKPRSGDPAEGPP